MSSTRTQSQLYTATPISSFVLIEFWMKILNFSLKNWDFRNECVNLHLQTLLNVVLILWTIYFLNFFRETIKAFLPKPFLFLFFKCVENIDSLLVVPKKIPIMENLTTSLDTKHF